jgi:hypothetical protein
MLRSRAPSNYPGTFFVAQFSAGYITNMPGFDLRQAQQAPIPIIKLVHDDTDPEDST